MDGLSSLGRHPKLNEALWSEPVMIQTGRDSS